MRRRTASFWMWGLKSSCEKQNKIVDDYRALAEMLERVFRLVFFLTGSS